MNTLPVKYVTMHTAVMQMENEYVNTRLYIKSFIYPPLYSLESQGLVVGISCSLKWFSTQIMYHCERMHDVNVITGRVTDATLKATFLKNVSKMRSK